MKYHDCLERQSNNDNNTKTTNLCEKSYITDTISSLALLTLKHNLTIISDTADQEKSPHKPDPNTPSLAFPALRTRFSVRSCGRGSLACETQVK